MKRLLPHILIAVSVMLMTSCSDSSESLPIHRLDTFVYNYPHYNDAQRRDTLSAYAPGIELYLMYNGERADDPLHALDVMAHSPAVVVFGEDVTGLIKDLTEQERELGTADSNIRQFLPDAAIGEVYSIVTANPYQSVVVSDSLVLVALNHYLGADYPGYNGLPDYMRRLKTADRIPADIVEAVISVSRPYEPSDNEQLVNRMLYDGAVLYAMHRILPDRSLGQLAGWSDDELRWLQDNESRIYGTMIENDLLYSTSEDDMQHLLDPSPVTSSINANAPGRAGRYIGYRIAEKYADSHDSDGLIGTMLSPDWYNDANTLAQSGYIYTR